MTIDATIEPGSAIVGIHGEFHAGFPGPPLPLGWRVLAALAERIIDRYRPDLPDLSVVDFETSGLDARTDEILEMAVIRTDPLALTIRSVVQVYVRPTKPVPVEAAAINGYSRQAWEDHHAVPLADALDRIEPVLRGTTLAGQHVSFDYSFLDEAGRRTSRPPIQLAGYRLVDTAALGYPLHLAAGLESPSLKHQAAYLGIPGEAHRAVADALRTREVLWRLLVVSTVAWWVLHQIRRVWAWLAGLL